MEDLDKEEMGSDLDNNRGLYRLPFVLPKVWRTFFLQQPPIRSFSVKSSKWKLTYLNKPLIETFQIQTKNNIINKKGKLHDSLDIMMGPYACEPTTTNWIYSPQDESSLS